MAPFILLLSSSPLLVMMPNIIPITIAFSLLLSTTPTSSAHALAFTPSDLLDKSPDGKPAYNGTTHDEIKCYALPYGAIGFASHILTYLTVICLSLGRNPLIPCLKLRGKKFNMSVSALGFLISFPLTVVTMVRCRNTWSFILIAVWKLTLSVTLTAMSLHAGRHIIDVPKPKQKKRKGGRGRGKGMTELTPTEDTIPMIGVTPPRNAAYLPGNGNTAAPYNPFQANPFYSPLGPSPGEAPPPYRETRTPSPDYRNSRGDYFAGYGNGYGYGGYNYNQANNSDDDDDHDETPDQQLAAQQYQYLLFQLDEETKARFHRIWIWSPLYFLGAVVGFVGVMNVVRKEIYANNQLKIVTGAFGGVVLFLILIVVLLSCCVFEGKIFPTLFIGLGWGLFVVTVLFALYTDWALAAIVGDVVGRPSRDNAVFYWLYFAAKRLPMLSF